MPNFLLGILPGLMAKYEYARDLLAWAAQWHSDLKAHKDTFRFPVIEPLLLSSLEQTAHDLGSVPLLKLSRGDYIEFINLYLELSISVYK